ncbi:hypothetical protein MRB53_040579 [Persea americana]|nr:hypothetical protein MRB53_040579 [Persea americana]
MTVQLEETEKRASKAVQDAHSKALEAERSKIADLENELEDSHIEKKLAEDRAQAEIKKVREDADRQRERWAVTELEMDNEIKSVEARLEAMRARAEEASTEADGAESSAKLLRQIELLQNQYNLAKTNWETIESSLNARLVAIEKDRDEVTRREAEIRKKARDAASKARKHAEETELGVQQIAEKDAEIRSQSAQIESLQRNAQEAEAAIADVRADFERQKRIWESELNARIEEEKTRWQQQRSQPRLARNDSSTVVSRKTSGVDIGSMRKVSAKNIPDLAVHPGLDRSFTRRSSAAIINSRGFASPDREILSPTFHNMEGALTSLHDNGIPPTPTIEADDDDFDRTSSPQQTINDLVSTNVSGAGPTVQLVERMSAAVRRLEGEKAARKDELALVASQRDEARDQIVLLMREVEDVRNQKARTAELEKDLSGVQQRYDACLEMLGEREEEVDELKADVVELKKIYRELVQEKVGG